MISCSVFVHNSSLAWSAHEKVAPFAFLSEGDEVEFDYSQGKRGIEAIKVSAVAQQSTRRKGTVVQFNDDKGYGFVLDNDPASIEGKQGVFSLFASVHLSNFPSNVSVMVHHNKIKGTGHKTLTCVRQVGAWPRKP